MNPTNEALALEIQSVQAIFPDGVNPISDSRIAVQCAPNVLLNIHLLPDYPNVLPYFEFCAPSVSGENKRKLLADLEQICADNRGEPMLYLLVDLAMEQFAAQREEAAAARKMGKENSAQEKEQPADEGMPYPSAFYCCKPIEDRKSVFQAHVAKLTSKDQVPGLLAQLKAVGKIARARHNPYAWRIISNATTTNGPNDSVVSREFEQHDCDDDGEDGAASKILRLLVQMDARGVLVVVSRWKNGARIGPDRFRHICNAARDALTSGGFVKNDKDKQSASG